MHFPILSGTHHGLLGDWSEEIAIFLVPGPDRLLSAIMLAEPLTGFCYTLLLKIIYAILKIFSSI